MFINRKCINVLRKKSLHNIMNNSHRKKKNNQVKVEGTPKKKATKSTKVISVPELINKDDKKEQ